VVRFVFQLRKHEMQARMEPLTTPNFVRGDKVPIVTTNLFLRGQTSMKLKERQLEPFTIEQPIGKHRYRLKLPARVRLRNVFMCTTYDRALPTHYDQLSQ
jgi:hypothetical protein